MGESKCRYAFMRFVCVHVCACVRICNGVAFCWAARRRNSFRLQRRFRGGPRRRLLEADDVEGSHFYPVIRALLQAEPGGWPGQLAIPPGKTNSNQSLAPKRQALGNLCRLILAYPGVCVCRCVCGHVGLLIQMQWSCLVCSVCVQSLGLIPGQTVVFDHILFALVFEGHKHTLYTHSVCCKHSHIPWAVQYLVSLQWQTVMRYIGTLPYKSTRGVVKFKRKIIHVFLVVVVS